MYAPIPQPDGVVSLSTNQTTVSGGESAGDA
jgi:hypothetical protein